MLMGQPRNQGTPGIGESTQVWVQGELEELVDLAREKESLLKENAEPRAKIVVYEKSWYVVQQAEPEHLNVFYTLEPEDIRKPHPALGLFDALVRRLDYRWVALFTDEVDEIFPEWPQGERFLEQARAKDRAKDFRKKYVSWYASTQHYKDVDHRVLTKFQYFIYLKGARPVHDSPSPATSRRGSHTDSGLWRATTDSSTSPAPQSPGTATISWTFRPLRRMRKANSDRALQI
ncbi:MAG: hypothetical protein ACE5HJ_04615 [Thermoplasmata archaeon]